MNPGNTVTLRRCLHSPPLLPEGPATSHSLGPQTQRPSSSVFLTLQGRLLFQGCPSHFPGAHPGRRKKRPEAEDQPTKKQQEGSQGPILHPVQQEYWEVKVNSLPQGSSQSQWIEPASLTLLQAEQIRDHWCHAGKPPDLSIYHPSVPLTEPIHIQKARSQNVCTCERQASLHSRNFSPKG